MKNPHCSRKSKAPAARAPRTENRIFEPSSGGIGIRLKSPSAKFAKVTTEKMKTTGSREPPGAAPHPLVCRMRIALPKIIARIRFKETPAAETIKVPRRTFLKYIGLNGTGLAQPKS